MGLWVNYAILLFALLPLAQCLPSMSPPNQVTVGLHQELHNGSAVPGDSPAKYHNDPANDLFNIESLDLYPNPCVMCVLHSTLLYATAPPPYFPNMN